MSKIRCCVFVLLLFSLCCGAQQKSLYHFQEDDSLLKLQYFKEAKQQQEELLDRLPKEFKDDYKAFYKERFKTVELALRSKATVTDPKPQQYLQQLLEKIVNANPELKDKKIRLLFSRDLVPNAYSIGDGTIIFNAGLMIFLDNEAEMAFVICHELAHFYLGHSERKIQSIIEKINSKEYKDEVKRINKLEYNTRAEAEKFIRPILFESGHHSREHEAEADRQAFLFMQKTGYDCHAAISTLQLLDRVNDTLSKTRIDIKKVFNFPGYAFQSRWIQNESSIFSEMKSEDDSPLSKAEKDSLKTHPDCIKRIALLEKDVNNFTGTGQSFLLDKEYFRQLQKDFYIEIAEQLYKEGNVGYNLYLHLLHLEKEGFSPVSVYAIARDLNEIYESQKNHTLGMKVGKESRTMDEDLRSLLRMIDRWKLNDAAMVALYYTEQYREQMDGYAGYNVLYQKAEKLKQIK